MADRSITITVTWKTTGRDSMFRPHTLVAALRRKLPVLFDRGELEPRSLSMADTLEEAMAEAVADSSDKRYGWDDYFVHPTYDIKYQ